MVKYYQIAGHVDSENEHLHQNNINTVEYIINMINYCTINPGISVIYDSETFKTTPYTGVDEMPDHSKTASVFINMILDFEKIYDDSEDYLILLLKLVKKNILDNYNTYTDEQKVIIKEIFSNLNLYEFFDEISSKFFKDKLNSYLEKL